MFPKIAARSEIDAKLLKAGWRVENRIKTKITGEGGIVEAGMIVDKRDRKTSEVRWQELDDDITYAPNVLDQAQAHEQYMFRIPNVRSGLKHRNIKNHI